MNQENQGNLSPPVSDAPRSHREGQSAGRVCTQADLHPRPRYHGSVPGPFLAAVPNRVWAAQLQSAGLSTA